jgi:hypothetical protein
MTSIDINGFVTVRSIIIRSMEIKKQAKKSTVVLYSGLFQNQNGAREHENTAAGSFFASSFV